MTRRDWSQVQAVLFDLDGTLIDSAPDLGHAANMLRAERGLEPLPLDRYRAMAGAGARGMLSIAFGLTPESPDFARLRERFFDCYEGCMHHQTRIFDQVEDMVAALEGRGLAWGVVTNKATRFTSRVSQRMPMLGRAAVIVSGDTTPHAKPHPAPLLHACSVLGVDPTAAIYVGDDLRDVQAGKAAGMGTVAALYGYLGADGNVTAWGADATIELPLQLLKLLGRP